MRQAVHWLQHIALSGILAKIVPGTNYCCNSSSNGNRSYTYCVRVDLNEGCFLVVFFPVFSRIFGISCFFPKIPSFRENTVFFYEKRSSIRSTLRQKQKGSGAHVRVGYVWYAVGVATEAEETAHYSGENTWCTWIQYLLRNISQINPTPGTWYVIFTCLVNKIRSTHDHIFSHGLEIRGWTNPRFHSTAPGIVYQ